MQLQSNRSRDVRPRAILLASLAGACLGTTALAQVVQIGPQRADANKLFLRSATVDIDQRSLALEKIRPDRRAKSFVIQLDGAMTPERRAALEDAGVDLGAYLPANAYFADLSEADAQRLRALEFVRWADEYRPDWKLAPEVINQRRQYATPERQAIDADGKIVLNVALFEDADLNAAQDAITGIPGTQFKFIELVDDQHVLTVITAKGALRALSQIEQVQFIEEAPEVTPRNSTTRWIVQTNVSGDTPLYDAGIRGEGQIVAVVDGRVDQNHCSFNTTPNKILNYNSSPGSDFHGTHVAGTVVGDAGVNDDTRGIAYKGQMVFDTIPSFTESAFLSVLNQHHNQGARIHTNSWGDDFTTSYNGLPRAIDVYSHENEDGLVLFAVTNGSTLRNPENAKNVLAVGASRDTPSQDQHCTAGIGPTADGRRKPEIYAPGCSTRSASASSGCGTTSLTGTSMACPAVAGTAMLARQYYMDGFYPSGVANSGDAITPTGSLVKATLLNSTRDMTGISGFPSNLEGWGRVTLDDTLFLPGDSRRMVVRDVRHAQGLSTGGIDTSSFNVNSQGDPLRVTLVWHDAPAAFGASFTPVNNLDLVVTAPDGTVYRGNNFSNGTSASGGIADEINNVEQVLVPNPQLGSWTVSIEGTEVNDGPQGFALVSTGDISEGPQPLSVRIDTDVPALLPPDEALEVLFTIDPGDDTLVPGSPALNLDLGDGTFQRIPADLVAGETYSVMIPGADCDDAPAFFVTAAGEDTGAITSPPGGADNALSYNIGVITTVFTDDFETDTGWTVTNDPSLTDGAWERGIPLGGGDRSDPPTDSDGSGQAYLTDPADGNSDVDGGPTILTSPAFDLSGLSEATISYDRWYENSDPTDFFVVEISDGGPWVEVEDVSPTSNGSWVTRTVNVSDFVDLTSDVRIRFATADEPNDSVLEAGVDAVSVTSFTCESTAPCLGDCDDSGTVDFNDLTEMLFAFGDPAGIEACDADGNGVVDFNDLTAALFLFGPCE